MISIILRCKQSGSGECELLSRTLCDSESADGFDLNGDPAWRYYDIDMDKQVRL